MRNKLLFILSLTLSISLQAQQKSFKINWSGQKNVAVQEKAQFFVPGFQEQNFSYSLETQSILFSAQWKESGAVSNAQLSQINYEAIRTDELQNIDVKKIPNQPEFKLTSSRARSENYFILYLNPLVNDNGVYKKITSFTVSYQTHFNQTQALASNVPPKNTTSVLAQGSFYKFKINQTGIYKLTSSFLKSLGMNPNEINPDQLKIYGHGGAMLPYQNSKNQYYDPPEVAVKVVKKQDQSLDYILFYGIGTEGNWNEDSETNLNLYADDAYYFITADGGNGKRIAPYAEPSQSPTENLTTFEDRDFYEVDNINVGKVGRRWFADSFSATNERDYEFNFPHLVPGSKIKVEAYLGAAAENSTGFDVTVNGQTDQKHSSTYSGISDLSTFIRAGKLSFDQEVQNDLVKINLQYKNNGNPAAVGYLDYINVSATRKLIVDNSTDRPFLFNNQSAANASGVGRFQIDQTQNVSEIWDISNPYQASALVNESGSSMQFNTILEEPKEFIALTGNYLTPVKPNHPRIENVNLKGNIFSGLENQSIDYLIIAPEAFLAQANRIAQLRKDRDGITTRIVTDQDIYTEFSSGKQDIAAIRNFVKYVYDNSNGSLKYLLLLGNASVDYKNRLQGNNNIIPTYESLNESISISLSSGSTASDDFFGMMDDAEGTMVGSDKLDIAVGRIPADDAQMARQMTDKIVAYEDAKSYGEWRNNFVLISDDADELGSGGSGLQVSLDSIGNRISETRPFINVKKIHSDAYEQVNTSGGQRYPEVNKAITNSIEIGATVVNYFGHGGEDGLASEFIVTRDDIKGWNNRDKYNVFVTVTCEFTRFDNPTRVSPGELVLQNINGGSAALVTTIRAIPVSTGTKFNKFLAPYLFEEGGYSVAEAVRKTKNDIPDAARRVVFFFGDPAMKLALAKPEINLTKINDKPINSQKPDTLKALSKIKISGEVVSPQGTKISNYQGVLTATVFDKKIERHTLDNDNVGFVMDFTTLGNVIFRGDATVKDGEFAFEFVVPKDIQMDFGKGRVSFYAKQTGVLNDNRGYNNDILVGGLNENAAEDNIGPDIELYMNDESFVEGGITNPSPILLAHLTDENGINTTSGIGHDIVAYIDNDETNPFVLNDYYKAKENDYTQGSVNYNLHDLEPGPHTLTFKAWDVYNNSNTKELTFIVSENDELKIDKVLNYPNPFHDYTEFWFNHNRPFEPLEVQVQVFTVSGKLVWNKSEIVNTEGFLSRDITWDGKDDFGNAIGKGVYVYKLSVKSTLTNKKVEKYEKLVIL